MTDFTKFYIDGKWVAPVTPKTIDVINPATEEPFARITLGSKADVDKAVAAAKAAFPTFSRTTKEERLALLQKIIAVYKARYDEIAQDDHHARWARRCGSRAAPGRDRHRASEPDDRILKDFKFENVRGTTRSRASRSACAA